MSQFRIGDLKVVVAFFGFKHGAPASSCPGVFVWHGSIDEVPIIAIIYSIMNAHVKSTR